MVSNWVSVSEGDSGPCILGLIKTRLLLFILVDISHDFSGNGNYCIQLLLKIIKRFFASLYQTSTFLYVWKIWFGGTYFTLIKKLELLLLGNINCSVVFEILEIHCICMQLWKNWWNFEFDLLQFAPTVFHSTTKWGCTTTVGRNWGITEVCIN